MSSLHRIIHPRETYRFSTTHTLSDYPLLIGEVLRASSNEPPTRQGVALFSMILEALGIRV